MTSQLWGDIFIYIKYYIPRYNDVGMGVREHQQKIANTPHPLITIPTLARQGALIWDTI